MARLDMAMSLIIFINGVIGMIGQAMALKHESSGDFALKLIIMIANTFFILFWVFELFALFYRVIQKRTCPNPEDLEEELEKEA